MIAPQHVVSVNADLTVQFKDRTVPLLGLQVGKDPRASRDTLERLLKTATEIRLVHDETVAVGSGPEPCYVEYVAMIDRTGPIWLDAGHMLVSQKLAVVDPKATFARRAEYEATEQKAQQGKGPRYPND
ncbi:MAG: hypothetical protein AB2A00_23705 [Myxococcota bacterium]